MTIKSKISGKDRFKYVQSLNNKFIKENKGTNLRIRDIAERLQVSEAELLCLGINSSVNFLKFTDINIFFKNILILDKVMFLTRNDEAVHEMSCKSSQISTSYDKVLTIKYLKEILLILNHHSIKYIFSEDKKIKNRALRSFQLFNSSGQAILKIYDKSDNASQFYKIINNFKIDFSYQLKINPDPKSASSNIIHINFLNNFYSNNFKKNNSYKRKRIANIRFLRELLLLCSKAQFNLGIYVPSYSSLQFYHGKIKKIVDFKSWLNILDPSFNLHIKENKNNNYADVYYSDIGFHINYLSINENIFLSTYAKYDLKKSKNYYIREFISELL
tara:strand:- start:1851 stop:2843 length:993 start_codon:yes stop_codon:yes gene_type:complete